MQLVGVKSCTYINSSKEINREDPKFKIGYIVRIPNIKTFSQKSMFQIGLKTFVLLKS